MIYIINGYLDPTRNPNQNLSSTYWVENSFIRKIRSEWILLEPDPNIRSPKPSYDTFVTEGSQIYNIYIYILCMCKKHLLYIKIGNICIIRVLYI